MAARSWARIRWKLAALRPTHPTRTGASPHDACVVLRTKVRFVHQPGFLLRGVVFLILLLLTFIFSLRSLLFVQPDRFDDGRPGQRIKPFRKNKHSKSRLIGGTEEIERVVRILPTRDDLLAVVIDLERKIGRASCRERVYI